MHKNLLNDLQELLTSTPILLRNRVCEECDWSLSTYYRKSKPFKDLKSGSTPHPGISNAEKEMIKRMAKEIKATINRDLDKILMY
ncbi:hypothetical protein [Chitinophaga arvensicola]|uniref:Uncharacterized protein n=1 Tax=Chitinophaga arvensicola TaxID=29529 RepID=A0A1I0S5B3_9BACT|nr:hypothetical protein [Chitinophaga arvensicola]SEW49939.1 hypothetical protein SAMN04488122_3642 [Chitinophaga arvensicola]